MKDPRNPSYIIYTQSDLIYMGLLKNVCSIESMRQMEEQFNEDVCIETLGVLSKHKSLSETRKNEEGKKTKLYYHKVLEAKLVLSEKIVISLGTEFIENESEDVSKQDCEINAAKRLLTRLKKEYKRLPLCIQGDALYAIEPMMQLCRKNGWQYIFTQKEGRQKHLAESYERIACGGGKTEARNICKESGTGAYVNHVEEVAGKTENEGFNN